MKAKNVKKEERQNTLCLESQFFAFKIKDKAATGHIFMRLLVQGTTILGFVSSV
jgi:hypothetical protein